MTQWGNYVSRSKARKRERGVKSQPKQQNFSVHSDLADRDVKLKCYLCNVNHRLEKCT